jgi:hypothetical protein
VCSGALHVSLTPTPSRDQPFVNGMRDFALKPLSSPSCGTAPNRTVHASRSGTAATIVASSADPAAFRRQDPRRTTAPGRDRSGPNRTAASARAAPPGHRGAGTTAQCHAVASSSAAPIRALSAVGATAPNCGAGPRTRLVRGERDNAEVICERAIPLGQLHSEV